MIFLNGIPYSLFTRITAVKIRSLGAHLIYAVHSKISNLGSVAYKVRT